MLMRENEGSKKTERLVVSGAKSCVFFTCIVIYCDICVILH